jgi:beta-galactosidase GanA
VRPATTALWFSETSDIWNDKQPPFADAKRNLYVAIKHQQLPLDLVIDEDALAGELDRYELLYLTDRHISRADSQKVAQWVAAGGSIFATAEAGMYDEFDQPNQVLRDLLGVEPKSFEAPPQAGIVYAKQDLPFSAPIDVVSWNSPGGTVQIPVIAARARFAVSAGTSVTGTFQDGSPAVAVRNVGRGSATYCGFLPSLSYFKPAIPLRPVDRGTTDDSMAHFIPTRFDASASALIGSEAAQVQRPVECSQPLVEASIIEAQGKLAIVLVNWSGGPVNGLQVMLRGSYPRAIFSRVSGLPMDVEVVGAGGKDQVKFTLDLEVADAITVRQ